MLTRAVLLARSLQGKFLIGSMGSSVVLVLNVIEDVRMLLGMDVEGKPS